MPLQGVTDTNIEPPGVPLRSVPGFELIGPSARMDYPNRRAVISTQPWVKPIGGTHGFIHESFISNEPHREVC